MKLKILDLFSGIGGFSLGLESTGHFETAAFCEIEPYCQKVLKKHWPNVPIFDDIRKLKGKDIGAIDIITGGYPCQPFSVAGKQKAEQDPRHLWPEYFRLIKELRPTWVIGENVSGHIKLGLDTVLENLASEGYSTRTFSISASSIGANHKRERVWTVANSSSIANAMRGIDNSLSKESRSWSYYEGRSRGNANGISHPSTNERLDSEDVADTNSIRWNEIEDENGNTFKSSSQETKFTTRQLKRKSSSSDVANPNSERGCSGETKWEDAEDVRQSPRGEETFGWWNIEPRVGRVAHGIPKRVDRLKSLGNAVVPHIPYYIGQAIIESYQ